MKKDEPRSEAIEGTSILKYSLDVMDFVRFVDNSVLGSAPWKGMEVPRSNHYAAELGYKSEVSKTISKKTHASS